MREDDFAAAASVRIGGNGEIGGIARLWNLLNGGEFKEFFLVRGGERSYEGRGHGGFANKRGTKAT